MADSVYGVVWASGLLMSMLGPECPMVGMGLCKWVFIDGNLNAQR